MSRCTRHLVTLFFLVVLASPVYVAASDPIPEPVLSFARSITGDAGPTAVATTPVPGLYEVRVRGEFVYVTADGRFFLHGDLYESRGRRNLTETSRREDRLEVVDAIEPDTFIVFAPSRPKHTVTVFTDVDCPYLREVPPRGARAQQARRAGSLCRLAPHSARNGELRPERLRVVRGRSAPGDYGREGRSGDRACHLRQPRPGTLRSRSARLECRGTPTIVTEDGKVIGGYVPFRELVQMLEQG